MKNNLTLREIKELRKDLAKQIAPKIQDFTRITGVKVRLVHTNYINFHSDDDTFNKDVLVDCEINLDYE